MAALRVSAALEVGRFDAEAASAAVPMQETLEVRRRLTQRPRLWLAAMSVLAAAGAPPVGVPATAEEGRWRTEVVGRVRGHRVEVARKTWQEWKVTVQGEGDVVAARNPEMSQ